MASDRLRPEERPLVTEVLIDLVHSVELVRGHESAGQLGPEYQPRLFGLLDLNNAHELARLGSRILTFESHNLILLWQSITLAILIQLILPASPVWIKAISRRGQTPGSA